MKGTVMESSSVELVINQLLEKLGSLQQSSSSAEDLKRIHSDVAELQETIEINRLFDKGLSLYSKWIEVALQKYKLDDKDLDLNAIDTELRNAIALAFNNRGYLKYLQVDFEGALQDYTRSLSFNENLPCAYYNRGLVTYRLAFFDQAVEDMTKAVNLDPLKQEFQEGLSRVKEIMGSTNAHQFRLEYDATKL